LRENSWPREVFVISFCVAAADCPRNEFNAAPRSHDRDANPLFSVS
jgi:hypothetical protein